MNASPLSAANSAASRPQTKAVGKGRNWIYSLTGVCFVFGGLLAMQLRAMQQVNLNDKTEKAGIVQAKAMVNKMHADAVRAGAEHDKQTAMIANLRSILAQKGSLSAAQVTALNAQIKEMQTIAGMTPLSGPGVSLTLSDNPNAGQAAGDTAFLPGLVHDFDLLQVVNELRSVKADAIAIKGAGGDAVRITGYTPIRCVGPVIYVNWNPVAAPFTIEAVGDPGTLKSALAMPNGIIDQLRTNGAIGVKVSILKNVEVPAALGGAPKLHVAKVTS